MLDLLFRPDYWQQKRWEYLDAARGCRKALTDPNGHWRYSPDDIRVRDAVALWVARARKAHGFSLGRMPVIPNAVVIQSGKSVRGSLYARGDV